MAHRTGALLVNSAILAGPAVQYWRGAPWLAIIITAGIALLLVNVLMLLKHTRSQPIETR